MSCIRDASKLDTSKLDSSSVGARNAAANSQGTEESEKVIHKLPGGTTVVSDVKHTDLVGGQRKIHNHVHSGACSAHESDTSLSPPPGKPLQPLHPDNAVKPPAVAHVHSAKCNHSHEEVKTEDGDNVKTIQKLNKRGIPVRELTKEQVKDNWDEEEKQLNFIDDRLTSVPDLSAYVDICESISLRHNCLDSLAGLEVLKNVSDMDLYLNELEKITHIGGLTSLTSLDLSFNGIRYPHGLDELTNLTDLFFVNNKIGKIKNIGHLTKLTQLEFGANRIRVIEGIEKIVMLRKLWLGKNKITKLQGLDTLSDLRILSLQSNRITKIENLEGLHNLEELYLSFNGIKKIENVDHLKKLRVLDLANNFIPVLENLEGLTALGELWLHDCQVKDWKGLNCIRSGLLTCLYLHGNPLHKDPKYRQRCLSAFPTLEELDGRPLPREALLRMTQAEPKLATKETKEPEPKPAATNETNITE